MELIVTDRESIERGIPIRSSYVVISIRDPEKPKARVRKQAGLRDVLYLAFDDAEPSPSITLPANIVLMTPDHAIVIWQFVRKWNGKVGAIVVHCEQGMSRSPAVAAAISGECGATSSRYFKHFQPNSHVINQLQLSRDVS